MNPAELRRKMAAKANEARSIIEKAKREKRALTEGERTRYEEVMADARTFKAEAEQLELVEGYTGPTRPENYGPSHRGYNPTRRTLDTEESIFCRVVRTGDQGALSELRASNDTDMNIGTAADGGDLVPVGHYNRIIERARPQMLYTQLGCFEVPGRGTTVNVPKDNEGDDGAFVSTNEASTFDRDAPAMAKLAMTLVKYTKKIELSVELLEDEDSSLLTFLEKYVSAGMAATMNTLLVTEALANGTAGYTFENASSIAGQEVPILMYKLGDTYANTEGVSWLMRRTTEGWLRAQTDDAFLFAPTPAGRPGMRGELFGAPVFNAVDMPAMAASAKSALIANWNYMGVRIPQGLTFLRDPYTLGHLGQVRLLYYFRTVFKVLQAEAFQYGTHPTG
jgi:HK97 family phage major capsid protein